MTANDGAARGWRARWVGRENERRRTAYDAALDAWRRRDAELRRLYAEAEEPVPQAEAPAGLPVGLDDGEVVLAVQPDAELVEVTARHSPELPTAELTVLPVEDASPRRPKGVGVIDAGTAVVTDRRLILAGRTEHHEWPYAEVAGIAHHPDEPYTLLHPDGPGRLRGVRVPRGVASAFRLRLTVAYAEATEARAALLDRLDDTVVAHWHEQPPVPAPATPADAPVTARLVRPALITAVAVALALAAVAGVVRGSVPDRPVVGMRVDGGSSTEPTDPGHPSPPSGAPVSPTATRLTGPTSDRPPGPAPTTTAATSATPAPTTGGPPGVPPAPPSETASPSPTPSPSTSPTPADRCGAPPNPYGYNYCGGSLVYDPAPDVCSWFACVDNLWDGNGYLVQCKDDLISRTGMQRGGCGDHGGTRRPVYVA
ncbi:hypothetical protein Q2K19_05540 [Micromonospora soli]|uniref:hypothetical protein n=1 Tax=Micromonospora sp. NBRC 110009 TaxID=3061627 RepID=UPI002671523A|nr:hypothetical protein [Micromonospora sp. NBRC 110009]WKT99952.1 hypothetical protein Q2K19_05540 [Micromonospora sp. NBRC 110009]